MDDHFYFRETDFNNYPFYVKDYAKRKCRHMLPLEFEDGFRCEAYQRLLVSTANFLNDRGYSHINFTLHRNMHMNRYILEEMKDLNDEIFNNDDIFVEGAATALNYRYTKYPFEYEICLDRKTNNVPKLREILRDKELHVFSTNDFLANTPLFWTISSLYPNKSKYEK
jgi:hypothetical protein